MTAVLATLRVVPGIRASCHRSRTYPLLIFVVMDVVYLTRTLRVNAVAGYKVGLCVHSSVIADS